MAWLEPVGFWIFDCRLSLSYQLAHVFKSALKLQKVCFLPRWHLFWPILTAYDVAAFNNMRRARCRSDFWPWPKGRFEWLKPHLFNSSTPPTDKRDFRLLLIIWTKLYARGFPYLARIFFFWYILLSQSAYSGIAVSIAANLRLALPTKCSGLFRSGKIFWIFTPQ